MPTNEEKRWLRKVVDQVKVPYDKSLDGTILYKTADILSCGHKKYVRMKNLVGGIRDDIGDPEHHYENRICHTCRSASDE